jgi:hypothetical protein
VRVAAISEQKKQVDIRIREQPSPPESSRRDQSKVPRLVRLGRNQIQPKSLQDAFDEFGALRHGSAAVAAGGEVPLNPRRFLIE